jgi:hypothetical protein
MSNLRFRISLSLDGFVAGPNQSVENPLGVGGMRLHEWAFPLAIFREMHGLEGGEVNESTAVIAESLTNVGATVMGRNMFGGHPGPWDAAKPSRGVELVGDGQRAERAASRGLDRGFDRKVRPSVRHRDRSLISESYILWRSGCTASSPCPERTRSVWLCAFRVAQGAARVHHATIGADLQRGGARSTLRVYPPTEWRRRWNAPSRTKAATTSSSVARRLPRMSKNSMPSASALRTNATTSWLTWDLSSVIM